MYTKAELNAAGLPGSAVMTKFGFYIHAAPLYALPNYTISMKHTTATNPSVYDGTGLTVVKTIPSYMPTAGKWDTLTLDTPFCWNGVNNILVDVCFDLVVPTWNASGQIRIFNASNGFRSVRSDISNQCGVATTTNSSDKPQARMRFQNISAPVANFKADTVCANLPTTFTNLTTVSCGTPTYFWDFAGLGTSTAVNPTFTFPAAGTYPVKLRATLGSLKDSIIKNVIVKPRPNPTISTSNPNICIGDPITITTTATGLIKWYVNDTLFITGGTSIYYVPKYNDTIQVEETAPNGCKAWSNTIIINRNPYPPKPTITRIYPPPTEVICIGDSVTLMSSSTTGNQWYIKSGTTYVPQSGATGQIFKYMATGNFVAAVEVTTPFNCKKRSNDFLVSVSPAVIPSFVASPTKGKAPQTVFFSDMSSGIPPISQYKWYFGTGDSSTLKNPAYTYLNPGTYNVTLQITPPAEAGCKGITVKNAYIVINADTSTTVVQDYSIINQSSVTISPNPASDNVNISYLLNKADNITLTISDLSGKAHFIQQENQAPGLHNISYTISDLPAGVYLVRIQSEKQNVLRKLVITR
ncbi:MAG: PKD domain-containing protein [Bacteroidia bacterium]|nr:PKD domain-containing protein [Bacteroidia bacterium]